MSSSKRNLNEEINFSNKRIRILEKKLEDKEKEKRKELKDFCNYIRNGNFKLEVKIELLENTLERVKREFGNYDKETIDLENEIAKNYFELDDFKKALSLYKIVFNKVDKDTIEFIDIYVDIANCHYSLEDYEKSMDMYENILDICKHFYNDDCKNVLYIKNSLCYSYFKLKLYETAKTLMEKQIPVLKRVFGEDNEETKNVKSHIIKCVKEIYK